MFIYFILIFVKKKKRISIFIYKIYGRLLFLIICFLIYLTVSANFLITSLCYANLLVAAFGMYYVFCEVG